MSLVDSQTTQGFLKTDLVINVDEDSLASLSKGLRFAIGVVRNFLGLLNDTSGKAAKTFPSLFFIIICLPYFVNTFLLVPSFNLEPIVNIQEYLRI